MTRFQARQQVILYSNQLVKEQSVVNISLLWYIGLVEWNYFMFLHTIVAYGLIC